MMNACPQFDHLLVFPHLHVQNANAVSSPLTHGFPSMTAFLGLMWALERKTRAAGLDMSFRAVGTVCHDYQEQVADSGFVKTFCLTRNPVDKDGSTAAIVEEGRIHLEVTLVFAVQCKRWYSEDTRQQDLETVAKILDRMRLAGGTFIPPTQPVRRRHLPFFVPFTGTEEDQSQQFRKLRMRLLPGFTLVARDDLLPSRQKELETAGKPAGKLDAWLSLCRRSWHYKQESGELADKGHWEREFPLKGWVVPIPVGYGALGALHPPGSVSNARDALTPFRFVESLYSVGEWISPHRLHSPQQFLWYADSQSDNGLYRCRNDYQPAPSFNFD